MSAHERERLSAYLDQELPPEERVAVEAHVRSCGECAAALAAMRAIDEAARDLPLPVEAPAGYFEALPSRLRARLEAEGTGPARVVATSRARQPVAPPTRLRLPAWAWAVAAALLLAVITPRVLLRARPLPISPSPVAGAPAPAAEALAKTVAAPLPAGTTAPTIPAAEPSKAAGGAANAVAPGRASGAPAKARAEVQDLALDQAAPRVPPAAASGLAAPPPVAPDSREERAAPVPPVQGAEPPAAFAAAPSEAEAMPAADALAAKGGAAPRAADARARKGETARPPVAGLGEGVEEPPPQAARESRLSETKSAEVEADRAFARLAAARPASVDEWRALRESWRRFLKDHVASPYTEEAWLRMIEAGFEAWRKGGQAGEAVTFTSDARAYLARPEAQQRERVRRLLAPVSETP